jgi:peptide-methionine (R)-S-oxide reductase
MAALSPGKFTAVKRSFPGGKSESLWRDCLTAAEFKTLIERVDEPPWRGKYLHKFPRKGYFACKGCEKPLFASKAKFDGGAGWASFQMCYENSLLNAETQYENDKEVALSVCQNCGIYVGKVYVGEFRTVSNERHCVNSLSIVHVDDRPPDITEVTLIYVPETKEDDKDKLDKETEALAARMLDFQIKSCKHLDKIMDEMNRLVRNDRTYNFNSDFTDAEFGELPISKYVASNLKKACITCCERHTPLNRCRGLNAWVCLWPSCWGIYCDRYIQNHREEKNHVISVSPSMACWCTACDRFVEHPRLKSVTRGLHRARYGTAPNSKDPTRQTGATILFSLGYANAPPCLCSACSHGFPSFYSIEMISPPLTPLPRHPSYIKHCIADSAVGRDKLLQRVKGFVYGACMGSVVGSPAFGLSKKQIKDLYGDKIKSRKLTSKHGSLLKRIKKRFPYRPGQWSITFDYFITAMASFAAFGGRVEEKDMAYRLAHMIRCGFPDIDKLPHRLSNYMQSVVQGDIEDYILNAQHHAKRVYGDHKDNPHSDNNDAVLRAMPMALRHFTDIDKMTHGTKIANAITHKSTKALAASVCLNNLIAKMLNSPNLQKDRPGMVKLQLECFSLACKDSRFNDYQEELRTLLFLEVEDGVVPLQLDDLEHCKDAFKTVGVAYWAAHINDPNFIDAIMKIVSEGGDTSGNAQIVGAIVGMKVGYSRLPTHLLQDMGNDRVWLNSLVDLLLEVMGLK